MSRADARVVAVVQARMSSSRLPGKVLAEIGGTPAIDRLIARLARARELAGIVVATSTDPSDDAIATTVEALGVPVVRGPLGDVLGRYRLAAERHPCDAVVRITADCPFIDPAVVDAVVRSWRESDVAYAANCLDPRTFPTGLDTEVVSRDALEAAAAEATAPAEREHVTPYLRERPGRFGHARVERSPSAGHVRIVLDTPEDLAFLRSLAARVSLYAGMQELLAAIDRALAAEPVAITTRVEGGQSAGGTGSASTSPCARKRST